MFGIAHIVIVKQNGLYDLHECSPWELAIAKGMADCHSIVRNSIAEWPAPEHKDRTYEQMQDILQSSDCNVAITE